MANSIGFDGAAWAVDGARVDGEIARVVAYAGMGGAEGVVTPGDCRVHELAVPGTQIAIDSGAVSILNRSPGVRNQLYVANGRTETRLDVTATDSSGGRSDLVVVRIEDPEYPGWETPAEELAADWQYTKPFIIENVPPTTTHFSQLNLGYAAYALARLDIPANTATITDAMVKNLRKVAVPRRERFGERYDIQYSPNDNNSTNIWVRFPDVPQTPLDIPEWATEMFIRFDLQAIVARQAALSGSWQVWVGPINPVREGGPGVPAGYITTRIVHFNQQEWDDTNLYYTISDRIDIPKEMRGTRQYLTVNNMRLDGVGFLRATNYTHVIADVEFIESAV